MREFAILLLIFFLAPRLWAADDCSTTPDLSVGLGSNFNQGFPSWCHSYTTTDLLTQKMQKLGLLKPGQRLHPLATAAITILEGGSAPDREVSAPTAPSFPGSNVASILRASPREVKWNRKIRSQNWSTGKNTSRSWRSSKWNFRRETFLLEVQASTKA